jgi:alkanesulfonate monooxygenase SsuD/methylene tetrahydromethanopterin reductase-like flavin-dependent oxidoreductase (luciferase family)
LLDLGAGTLAIEPTRVVVDGKVIESDGKTENAQHLVALDPFTQAALTAHVETLDRERKDLGPNYWDHGLLFCWAGLPRRRSTRLLTTLDVLSDGRLEVGVGLGWMKDEYDIVRGADWHRRGKMLDNVLALLHAWWTTTPVSWDSEFFSLPPVHADLRPVQAGGPPIWIGGASEAAMRRVGRSGTGWLGFEGLPDEVTDHLWSIARRAAQDAGRDPDALKTAMRINLEPGTSVDSLAGKLARFAGSGIDEAFVDAFALFPSLDQMLDFASQVIARTGRL